MFKLTCSGKACHTLNKSCRILFRKVISWTLHHIHSTVNGATVSTSRGYGFCATHMLLHVHILLCLYYFWIGSSNWGARPAWYKHWWEKCCSRSAEDLWNMLKSLTSKIHLVLLGPWEMQRTLFPTCIACRSRECCGPVPGLWWSSLESLGFWDILILLWWVY